ncbi:MAG: oligosaccharide flippase family protein [Anaerolineales bacterium]|nr:oligosaccharide flippase family protein [Anaerolineales bacterium]MBX3036817.1 oligosaccharide flippase family protein [Anaerolineales bacterium]
MTLTATQPAESVRRRYIATLFTQFIQLIATIITSGIVPRALGPAAFGNYNFLLNTASTIRSFLDPSANQAFFTFSSQQRQSGSLTKTYALLLLFQIVIVFGLIGILTFLQSTNLLWPHQALDQILWVTILEWCLFVTASLRQLGDSKGLTVRTQAIVLMTAFINIVGLLGLNYFEILNFYTYVWLNLFTTFLIGLVLGYWLLIVNRTLTWDGNLTENVSRYINRWWAYASPLILLEYYKPIVAYLGIYLLQRWYGSVEQGNFALATKWSALVLVFTSSALSIFWREIANAMANGEQERATRTYYKFTNFLFFVALVLCAWLSFTSHLLVDILVGDEYQAAIPVLALMAFYPLQQTYGQINTAALKGAEKTKQIRDVGILISIPDVALSYFLLASPNAPLPGLNLGAMGVAIRMVIYGLISVQAYEWMSHRTFGLNYFSTLIQKLSVVVLVFLSAWLALTKVSEILATFNIAPLIIFIISTIIYFIAIATIALFKPNLLGIGKDEMNQNANKILTTLKKALGLKHET